MQRDQSDLELTFKKRARRRLVGAIALVLLMIIVLPMVLKDRASNPQEKIKITLPNEASTTVTPAPAPADFDSAVVPTETVVVPDTPAVETSEAVLDNQAATDTEAKIDNKVAAKPSVPEEKEAPKREVKKAETEMPAAEKAASAHKFYVQIGVFSDPANVKQLQIKLSGLGYKSQTEKIQTDKGEKIRLKTQLFGERNEAAIALENIKDAGLTGMVVSQ